MPKLPNLNKIKESFKKRSASFKVDSGNAPNSNGLATVFLKNWPINFPAPGFLFCFR